MLTGTAGPHPDDGIESSLRHLRAMGLHTHRPFTLRLLHEWKPADGDPVATVEQTGRMFETVGTWITRLWLTGRTAGLNTAFARLAGRDPVTRETYLDDWMMHIRKLRRQDVGVPTDEELVHGVHTREMWFGKRARTAVLCALMEDEDGEVAPRAALWTERVMPYRLTDDWREMLGPDARRNALGMALPARQPRPRRQCQRRAGGAPVVRREEGVVPQEPGQFDQASGRTAQLGRGHSTA